MGISIAPSEMQHFACATVKLVEAAFPGTRGIAYLDDFFFWRVIQMSWSVSSRAERSRPEPSRRRRRGGRPYRDGRGRGGYRGVRAGRRVQLRRHRLERDMDRSPGISRPIRDRVLVTIPECVKSSEKLHCCRIYLYATLDHRGNSL